MGRSWRDVGVGAAYGFGHIGVKGGDHFGIKVHIFLVGAELLEALRCGLLKHLQRVAAIFPQGRVQGHEQGLGLVVPAPPEVAGQVAQAGQFLRHFGHGHDGPQEGRSRARGREYAGQGRVPGIVVRPHGGFFEGQGKGLKVVGKKVVPGAQFGQAAVLPAPLGPLVGRAGDGLEHVFVQHGHALLKVHAATGMMQTPG